MVRITKLVITMSPSTRRKGEWKHETIWTNSKKNIVKKIVISVLKVNLNELNMRLQKLYPDWIIYKRHT